jgi:hypothetical protein
MNDKPSEWTVDTLHTHIQRQIDDLRSMLDDRYTGQTKALDAALAAQQLAMATAFTAADTAVKSALEAAEKATTKAENAADKRFEATNEFRQQLGDQANTFMPRTEAVSMYDRNTERIQELAERVTRGEGHGTGLNSAWVYVIGAVAVLSTVITIYHALSGK